MNRITSFVFGSLRFSAYVALFSPLLGAAALAASSAGIYIQDRNHSRDLADPKAEASFLKRVDTSLSAPWVKGFAIEYFWRSFAPAAEADSDNYDKYNFDPIDRAIDIAKQKGRGQKISISILAGAFTPDYVLSNCATFTYTHTMDSVGQRTAAVPFSVKNWINPITQQPDPNCYFRYFDRAVHALAKHYDGNPNIRYIEIIGPSTLFGVETNWPMRKPVNPGDNVSNLGFTLDRYVQYWQRNIRLFVSSFPHTPLALGLHNEIDYPGVQQAAASAAVRKIRDFAIPYYAQHTKLADKKIILRLLGLSYATGPNPSGRTYFLGPYDPKHPTANLTDYVSLVWEKKNNVTIMYEGSTFSRKDSRFADQDYLNILWNGYTWGGQCLDLAYPDIFETDPNAGPNYAADAAKAASWYPSSN